MSADISLLDSSALMEEALKPRPTSNAISLLGAKFLLPPTVHFVAAITKHGKTNFAANLAYHVVNSYAEGGVLVGLNEEPPLHFLTRCGCMMAKLSFTDWINNKLDDAQIKELGKALAVLSKRIKIINEEQLNLGCVEDVEKYLRKYSKHSQVKLIIFDYLQNLHTSKEHPGKTTFELYKVFGVRLKDIGKTAKCPIVVFGQLKENAEAGFKSRVEGDSWFVNNVASGLELRADKVTKQSTVIVQVDRHQNSTHMQYWFSHAPSGLLTPTLSPQEIEEASALDTGGLNG